MEIDDTPGPVHNLSPLITLTRPQRQTATNKGICGNIMLDTIELLHSLGAKSLQGRPPPPKNNTTIDNQLYQRGNRSKKEARTFWNIESSFT